MRRPHALTLHGAPRLKPTGRRAVAERLQWHPIPVHVSLAAGKDCPRAARTGGLASPACPAALGDRETRMGIETGTDVVEQRLNDWRRRLIDLSHRNRLIAFKPTKAT